MPSPLEALISLVHRISGTNKTDNIMSTREYSTAYAVAENQSMVGRPVKYGDEHGRITEVLGKDTFLIVIGTNKLELKSREFSMATEKEACDPERREAQPSPIPMILFCPSCHARHIDSHGYEVKVHTTHACQCCGFVWRPALIATVGVQFLPGFKNNV